MLLDTARAGLKFAILIPLHFNLAQRKFLVTKLGLQYHNCHCLIKFLTYFSQFHFVQYRVGGCRVSGKYVRGVSASRRRTYGRLNLKGLYIYKEQFVRIKKLL